MITKREPCRISLNEALSWRRSRKIVIQRNKPHLRILVRPDTSISAGTQIENTIAGREMTQDLSEFPASVRDTTQPA